MSAGDDRPTWPALVAMGALAVALYAVFRRVDAWAELRFAQARLASMLVAVIDVAVFAVALCLAPSLSRLVERVFRSGPKA
jgi:hypothetical protein